MGQNARLFALRGHLLSESGRNEEANRSFSASVQLSDGHNRSWRLWAEHLHGMYDAQRLVDDDVPL